MGPNRLYFLLVCSCLQAVNAFYTPEGITFRKCGSVHLTVSALQDTYLELNWITDCDSPNDVKPDFIALYDSDPRERDEEIHPRTYIYAKDFPSGYYKTKVKFGHPYLPGNWEDRPNLTRAERGPHCFPYWIASIKANGGLIDVRCLAIQPTWMFDNRDRLGTQRIGGIIIPGTHNSASNEGLATFLENYILNQDRSIWTQLVFGIRYFDFRIGYYENEGFFINHDLVRVQPLIPVLQEVKKFIELAPAEIVILDFHRFPFPSNFGHNLHTKLHNILKDLFEHTALAPNGLQAGKGPTLNEIWHQNKNVIICYGKLEIAREYSWYWNPLQQHWGNRNKVRDLKHFLNNAIHDHKAIQNPMWALMAELTPQPIDLLFRTNNLRKLADDVNKHVTKWIRDEWHKDVNIVATDFFLGNDIINVAIEVNRHR